MTMAKLQTSLLSTAGIRSLIISPIINVVSIPRQRFAHASQGLLLHDSTQPAGYQCLACFLFRVLLMKPYVIP